MKRFFSHFVQEDKGATAIEYGLIASFIALAIVGALLTLGPTLSGAFQTVQNDL